MKGLYEVVRGAVDAQTLSVLKWAILIEREARQTLDNIPLDNLKYFAENPEFIPGDNLKFFSPYAGEGMLVTMLPLIQKIVQKRLYPTYSFARIYWKGSSLIKHVDRRACEYSMTLCIDCDPEPWGIWVDKTEILLNPGDLVIYKGQEAYHWRNTYTGNRTIQMFLHYVNADGPHADCKFDRRKVLGLPNESRQYNGDE
jgi:hypothetical protein